MFHARKYLIPKAKAQKPPRHPFLEGVLGWLSIVYERGRLASAADKEVISAAPASKPCWQRSYLVFTWIYRKAVANFSREPENRVQKVLYGASFAGNENSANGIRWLILAIGSK